MAINTAQTGRVFEDRSHAFYLISRPSGILKYQNELLEL
jgi:hypothetical protein